MKMKRGAEENKEEKVTENKTRTERNLMISFRQFILMFR